MRGQRSWGRSDMHWLLSVEVANWKIVSVLAALFVVAAAAAATLRRRHVVVLAVSALAVGTLAGADAVNAYYGYLPQVADVVGVTDWRVIPTGDVLAARAPGR